MAESAKQRLSQPNQPPLAAGLPGALGLVAVLRAFMMLSSDIQIKTGANDTVGMLRRYLVRDISAAAPLVIGLACATGSDSKEVIGAVASTSAGWILSAVALFFGRDFYGADPQPREHLTRRVLAALAIVLSWVVWAASM